MQEMFVLKVKIIRRATYHLKVESTTRRQGEPDPESEGIIIGLLFTKLGSWMDAC